jgi:hypothetical protein
VHLFKNNFYPSQIYFVLKVKTVKFYCLTAGFAGWDVERGDDRTVLRRAGATRGEVRAALAEVRDLGLDLESFRRLDRV